MLFLSIQALTKPSKNKHLRNLIALCVLLTPMYSLANDHFSSWSDKTICRLAKATPDNVEYQAESTKRGLSCGVAVTQESSSSSQKVERALAGIDIENDPTVDFFKPWQKAYSRDDFAGFYLNESWQMGDFNKDGYTDVIYVGSMYPANLNETGENPAGSCGGGRCKGDMPLPQLFFGDENHQLTHATGFLIDNRDDPGMSLGHKILIADYNNDEVLDFYVGDTGIGTHDGFRDSYFLSQPNGTWLESSNTHLSHGNFEVFNHGAATGDIDNDGNMDVVITQADLKAGTHLWCLMNDGTGYLKKRKCGGVWGGALELGDMDGDGDLDAIIGAAEFIDNDCCNFTGIIWNNGRGNFNKNNNSRLPQHKKKWGGLPEVSAADLDNDGDLDIVFSRVGILYVGTAVQVIENLGNKKFKDHGVIVLREAPAGYVATSEGNPYNDFIPMIKFVDLDKDGDMDVFLGSAQAGRTNGTVLLNEGDFNFTLLTPSKAYPLYAKDHDH